VTTDNKDEFFLLEAIELADDFHVEKLVEDILDKEDANKHQVL